MTNNLLIYTARAGIIIFIGVWLVAVVVRMRK